MVFSIGLIWPAIIGAAAALAQGGLNSLSAKSAQKRSIDAQRSLQNILMTGGAQQARSAKQAGLSPAFSLGSSSVPAASTPASPAGSFDFSNIGALLSNKELRSLQKQQQRREEAATKTEEANARSADTASKKSNLEYQQMLAGLDETKSIRVTDPDTGEVLTKEQIDAWKPEDHNGLMPNVETDLYALSRARARGEKSELETQEVERGGRQREVSAQDIERENRISQARFNKAIADARQNNRAIMQAVISMPEKEYEHMANLVEKEGLEIAFQKLYNKQFEESSAGRLIDKLQGNGTFGDKFLAVLAWIANNVRLSATLK